jgi:hypothetical protein
MGQVIGNEPGASADHPGSAIVPPELLDLFKKLEANGAKYATLEDIKPVRRRVLRRGEVMPVDEIINDTYQAGPGDGKKWNIGDQ